MCLCLVFQHSHSQLPFLWCGLWTQRSVSAGGKAVEERDPLSLPFAVTAMDSQQDGLACVSPKMLWLPEAS